MLLRQDRRGHQHGDLLAVVDRQEGGPQGHLGLAVADVPADQPVHGSRLLHVLQHLVDGLELIRRFFVGKPGLEIPEIAVGRTEGEPGLDLALRVKLQELAGHLLRRALDPRHRPLPGLAAELVQRGRVALDPHVLLDHAHAVDREVELVAAVVGQGQKIVAHPLDRELLESLVPADSVFGVHDQISLLQLLQVEEPDAGLGVRLRPANVPNAENLVLAHHRQALGRPHEAVGHLTQADNRL